MPPGPRSRPLVLPVMDMLTVPGILAPLVWRLHQVRLDVASDLLSPQREFVLQLARALAPEKTIRSGSRLQP